MCVHTWAPHAYAHTEMGKMVSTCVCISHREGRRGTQVSIWFFQIPWLVSLSPVGMHSESSRRRSYTIRQGEDIKRTKRRMALLQDSPVLSGCEMHAHSQSATVFHSVVDIPTSVPTKKTNHAIMTICEVIIMTKMRSSSSAPEGQDFLTDT